MIQKTVQRNYTKSVITKLQKESTKVQADILQDSIEGGTSI